MPSQAAKRLVKTARAHFPRRRSSLFPRQLRFPHQLPRQLSQRGTSDQRQLSGLGNRWPPSEHGIVLAHDSVQNFLPAAAEEFNISRQFTFDLRDKRQPLRKPFARAFHFKLHHLAKRACVVVAPDHFFPDTKAAQVFERKINPSLGKIYTYVLPEIRQLKRCTSVIGEQLTFAV